MSFHRSMFVAIATFLTVGTTSAFAGCCDWGTPAPVAYNQGCGGCGQAAYAPMIYATPIAPAPITVSGCNVCGTPTITYVQPVAPPPVYSSCGACGAPAPVAYSNPCGGCAAPVAYSNPCGGCGVPTVYSPPAPIYVVNQGPDYSGPGVMVPYHTYAPRAEYAPPPAYPPYLYRTHRYYPAAHVGYGLGYGAHSFYRPRAYGPRPGYAPRMVYGPSPHAYGPRPSMMHRPYWHG